jgi:hypothetical protein
VLFSCGVCRCAVCTGNCIRIGSITHATATQAANAAAE